MTAAVLVLGGGLTGLQAAVELADAGARAIVLEQGPILGGKRAAWLDAGGDLNSDLWAVGDNEAIEYLTLAGLETLVGEAGDFVATVQQKPRFVTADCTRCNHCVPVCPQVVSNEYDAGLTFRKAIHSPLSRTLPDIYAIDIDSCLNKPPNYLPCQRCVEVCDDNAIHFDMPVPAPIQFHIAAVIVATGYADNSESERVNLAEFGYGQHPDIVSSVELQRLLEDPGPSGGFAIKPSNEGYPDSVLMVLTRVSSGASWVMSNQLRRLAAQDIELISVLVLASNSEDPVLDGLKQAVDECNATLQCGSWIGAEAAGEVGLQVRFASLPAGSSSELNVELVVLSTEVQPDTGVSVLAEKLGLLLDGQGYLAPARPGVFLAGGALGTVGVEAGAAQARAAVQGALQYLHTSEKCESEPGSPDWPELPAEQRQRYLEQMLHALMKLGEGGGR